MKLQPMQWASVAATFLFFTAVLLDVAGALNVPRTLLIFTPILLLLVNVAVGPSLKDLSRMNRRG